MQLEDKRDERTGLSVGELLLLAALLGLTVGCVHIATLCRVGSVHWFPGVFAGCLNFIAFVIPSWIATSFRNGSARQLTISAFRIATLLPSIGFASWWAGAERNYFLTALLACYFVALPVESWLLIREVRRDERSGQ